MALARKCTRCDRYYDDYYAGGKGGNKYNALLLIDRDMNNQYYSVKTADLCKDCKDSFDCWLTTPEKEPS